MVVGEVHQVNLPLELSKLIYAWLEGAEAIFLGNLRYGCLLQAILYSLYTLSNYNPGPSSVTQESFES